METEFCSLCFLQAAFEAEVPRRVHAYKLLAENGNPANSESFVAHLECVMGLMPPKPGQNLREFRLARKRYSSPSPSMYPVTSALWEMMGYQPPLATPLMYCLMGLPEAQIAVKLGISQYNVSIRLVKAARLALRFVRHDRTIEARGPSYSARRDNADDSYSSSGGKGRDLYSRPQA